MRKRAYFDSRRFKSWPTLEELEPYFLAPPGKQWFDTGGNDTAGLHAEGVEGTEHFGEGGEARIDVDLQMWGNPDLGVLLIYTRWGGGHRELFSSVGDLSRLGEIVESKHRTKVPVGLFIPFERAWVAVKEFIETDGKLPTSIEWIANKDLPPYTFPAP
jgi:hypothetical protein